MLCNRPFSIWRINDKSLTCNLTVISELVTVTVASTADAESAYLAQLAAIVGAEAAAKILMNRQALEGYATITTNPASTVYLPNSVPAVIDLKQK